MKEANFKYEELARKAFNNCEKYGDPFKYAAQECFANFVPVPSFLGQRMLSTILIKLITSHSDRKEMIELIGLENKVWDCKTQAEIIAIIDKAKDLTENW